MSYPDTHEGRVRFLQDQLSWATARKLTPASKRSRDPAKAIDALASIRDGKGNKVNMTFKLATVQMQWFEGQELTYKTRCPECRKRQITVNTTYESRNAIWPPVDGFPDRCEACAGEARLLKAGDIDPHGRLVLSDQGLDGRYQVQRGDY